MSEYVRVKQVETGHELSVPKSHADAVGGYEVLDKDAVDLSGNPLPPKYRTTVKRAAKTSASKAASQPSTAGRQADDKKEND